MELYIPDDVLIQLTVLGCSKHVEKWNKHIKKVH